MSDYLTTRELAALLRIKERKVYDLAASGTVPVSRAFGKLLFPRADIEAWLAAAKTGPDIAPQKQRTTIFLGSHDPLLDWALRESGCGIPTYFDGSSDGLQRFLTGEGVATGLHLYDASADDWNTPTVIGAVATLPIVVLAFCVRRRGLIVRAGDCDKITNLRDVEGRRVVQRQIGAGAQSLLEQLCGQAGVRLPGCSAATDDLSHENDAQDTGIAPARSEMDAALAVSEGSGDVAFGLEVFADRFGLAFTPLIDERFDLVVDRKAYFEQPLQTFFAFCRTNAFQAKARSYRGYDVSGVGTVRHLP